MYPHRYKAGKQKAIMPLATFQALIQDAINSGETLEALAFITLLWHTGVRKSEAYERVISDVEIGPDLVTVDFHKRKKGGDEVPALKIPKDFYGVKEFLVPWIRDVQKHRASKKQLFSQRITDKTRVTAKGKTVSIKETVGRIEKGNWLFPNIASTKAWTLVKRILGEDYYPHYLRLRKLSAIGKNPQTKSLVHIKAVSGLKSLRAIEAYLGFDEETQDEAMRGSE